MTPRPSSPTPSSSSPATKRGTGFQPVKKECGAFVILSEPERASRRNPNPGPFDAPQRLAQGDKQEDYAKEITKCLLLDFRISTQPANRRTRCRRNRWRLRQPRPARPST